MGFNHCLVWKTQSFLWKKYTDTFQHDCCGKSNVRKSNWSAVGMKIPIGSAYSYSLKTEFNLFTYVDDINFVEKKTQNIHPMCQHLSLIMYTWGALKDNVKWARFCWQLQDNLWIQNFRKSNWKIVMLGFFFCILRCPTIWKDTSKYCTERYYKLTNKTTQQPHKVSTPCIYDDHDKKEKLKSVWELSKVCSQIVLI